jgi:hypothetical protein
MPSLPWQAKVRAESSRSPPTCRMGEYKFASSPRFGRTNSNRPLLGLEYRCRQGIDGMIDTEGLRGGFSLRPLARRKGPSCDQKISFSANWISLFEVDVESNEPAPPTADPS